MRAEFSCFGFTGPAADGLFFALFPDAPATRRVATTADQLCIRHRLGGRPLAAEGFHVSLLGFGTHNGLPQSLVRGAIDAAATVSLPSFEVTFDRATSFLSQPRPLVLCGDHGAGELAAFQRALGDAVQSAGLLRVKPQWTPHITLLYDEHAIEEHAIEPVRWSVREFVLVHSERGRSRYNILGRWPLREPLPLAG